MKIKKLLGAPLMTGLLVASIGCAPSLKSPAREPNRALPDKYSGQAKASGAVTVD